MPTSLVDTHCHLNFFSNAGDIALECEKSKTHTLYVTTLPSQFEESYKYIKHLKYVYPALGFHCLESDYNLDKEKNIFIRNIKNTQFIGEVGLDYSKRALKSKEEQLEILEFVLSSIRGQNKFLTVHSNSAEDDLYYLLKKYNIKNVIFHWYLGKISTLKQLINEGYYFSINLSMCKSKKGQNIISKLPKESLLIETDAPFIKNVLPYQNLDVYEYLGQLWNVSLFDVKVQILKNFHSFKRL